MRSALILGSGRSGTSMVAGSLAASGAHQGEALYAPRACNPKGFFESPEINGLNEDLMRPALAPGPRLVDGALWLGTTDARRPLASGPELERRLTALCARRPFVYKDPRFAWTLPAWRPHLRDAGLVCVFRHPSLTVRSVVEEVASADYLREVVYGPEDARAMWIALHERLLDETERGDWLFLHYDQMLAGTGAERLARFLDAPVDRGFAERRLRRTTAPDDPGPRALELYRELCARAGHTDPVLAARSFPAAAPSSAPVPAGGVNGSRTGDPASPHAIGFAVVRDEHLEHLADLLADLTTQRGVALEPVLIDDTHARSLDAALAELAPPDGLRVVRPPRHSVARALAALAAEAPVLVGFEPGARALPHRAARALEALAAEPEAGVVVHVLQHTDDQGQFRRPEPVGAEPARPGPFWAACATWRAEALAELDPRAFRPALLERLQALDAAGRMAALDEPLTLARARDLHPHRRRALLDAHWLELERAPAPHRPAVTVLLAHHRRPDAVYECLESICRQTVGPHALELVVVDDNSPVEQVEALRSLELPVSLTVLRQDGGGAANARNLGLPHARGDWVLFVNDDTIADLDLVERHLAAHAEIGRPAVVLGHFRQPTEALDNALLELLERTTLLFGYSALEPGGEYDGTLLYTCNASAPLAAVRAVGAFDPDFSHYGCEDTDLGLRLEDAGLPTVYRPECRAVHRHRITFDILERRQPLVGRAHARLFTKHPRAFAPWSNIDPDDERGGRATLSRSAPAVAPLRRALRSLAELDLGALSRLDPDLARALGAVLEDGLTRYGSTLWWRGFLRGFEEQRAHDFGELLARSPREVHGAEGPFAILRVRAGHAGWLEVAEHWFAAAPHDETLLVWTDAADGEAPEGIEGHLEPMRLRARARGRSARAALLATEQHPREAARTLALAERWLPTLDPEDVADAERAAAAGVLEEDRGIWPASAPAALGVPQPWRVAHRARLDGADDPRRLAALAGPLVGAEDAAVLLVVPTGADPSDYLAALEAELARLGPEAGDLELVLRAAGSEDEAEALFAACVAATEPGGGREHVRSAADVERLLARCRALRVGPLPRVQLAEPRRARPYVPEPEPEPSR